jgi:tRNA threonylcarbamoyl adenosine modification protein YeaZ
MRILSFDTSTPNLHISLSHNDNIVVDKIIKNSSENRQEVGQKLIPEIKQLLAEASYSKHDLSAIIVGIGPGSFTGIRIGVITARTIAQILKIPLLGISIFETLAYQLPNKTAAIVLASTSSDCYFASYQNQRNILKELIAPCCINYDELANKLIGIESCQADEKSIMLASRYHNKVESLSMVNNTASLQAKIALNKLVLVSDDDKTDKRQDKLLDEFAWWKVMPLYLRHPSVTVKKQ